MAPWQSIAITTTALLAPIATMVAIETLLQPVPWAPYKVVSATVGFLMYFGLVLCRLEQDR